MVHILLEIAAICTINLYREILGVTQRLRCRSQFFFWRRRHFGFRPRSHRANGEDRRLWLPRQGRPGRPGAVLPPSLHDRWRGSSCRPGIGWICRHCRPGSLSFQQLSLSDAPGMRGEDRLIQSFSLDASMHTSWQMSTVQAEELRAVCSCITAVEQLQCVGVQGGGDRCWDTTSLPSQSNRHRETNCS